MKTKTPKKKLAQYGFGTGIQTQIFGAASNYLLNSATEGLNTIFSNHAPTADGQMFDLPDGGQIMAMGGVINDPVMQQDHTKVTGNSTIQPPKIGFEDWLKSFPEGMSYKDYDLQSYYNKYGATDVSKGQHLPDEFKLPTHTTFSNESIYSTPEKQGGAWQQDKKGTWSFTPSKWNIKNVGVDSLKNYFKESEPNSKLILPKMAMGGIIDTLGTKSKSKIPLLKPFLVEKADGTIGQWGNPIIPTPPPAVPIVPPIPISDKARGYGDAYFPPNQQMQGKSVPTQYPSRRFALGGITGANAEVEGGEVAQLPNGQTTQFQGPSHENGGIPVDLPQGTKIYSDRLAVDGKTMQQRKQSRERQLTKLSKILEKNPTDAISKNSAQRQKAFLDLQEQQDLMMQEAANQTYQIPQQSFQEPEAQPQFAMGTGGGGTGITSYEDWMKMITPQTTGVIQDPSFHPTSGLPQYTSPTNPSMIAPRAEAPVDAMPYTTGDKVGFLGNLVNGIAPLATTIANRSGDNPNVNSFKNFGNNAIQANKQAMSLLGGIKDKALTDIQTQATGQRVRNRNSAGSVSVNRALDLATTAQSNAAIDNTYANYAQQIAGQYNEESKLDNQQDLYVEQGAQGADRADRMDRDSYYSNLGQNLANIGSLTQKTGKEMNEHKYSNDVLDLLPELSKYGLGYTYDETGKPVLSKVK
jgi:hypothetical protein